MMACRSASETFGASWILGALDFWREPGEPDLSRSLPLSVPLSSGLPGVAVACSGVAVGASGRRPEPSGVDGIIAARPRTPLCATSGAGCCRPNDRIQVTATARAEHARTNQFGLVECIFLPVGQPW